MTLAQSNASMGPPIETIQQVVLQGDLNQLTPDQKIGYVAGLCEHLGIKQAGKPFDLIKFQGKEVAYPNKGCAEQLRNKWLITIDTPVIHWEDDTVYVTVTAHMGPRQDTEIGAVFCASKQERGNATKKALTQAKRRVTFSMVGLSMFNEEDVPLQTVDTPPPPAELPPADPTTPAPTTTSEAGAPSSSGISKDAFASKCKDLGAALVNAAGPSGKKAYREVLEKAAGVKQANHVKPEHFDQVIGCLEELVAEAGTEPINRPPSEELIEEIAALEAAAEEEDMLNAWDAAVGANLDPQPELADLSPEQLTKYRDLLKHQAM
jgi:hypothetical protein